MNNIARRDADRKGARVKHGQRAFFEEGDSLTYVLDEGYYRSKARGPVDVVEAEEPEPQVSLSTIMAVFVSQPNAAHLRNQKGKNASGRSTIRECVPRLRRER